jgi:DNA-binding GntR family transcriptional regulator
MTDATVQTYDFRIARQATPLRQLVTDTIRNAIAMGHFKSGDRMPERDLCEMTGVSRTLIREALRQLESEGIITVIAHRGPVVASITVGQASGIYQVRELLEGLAAELFARNATDADRAALSDALDEVERAFATNDVVRWLAAKNRFYDCLLEGSKNEALAASLSMLNSRMTILRARSLRTPERRAKSIGELRELQGYLLAREAGMARETAAAHVRKAGMTASASMQAEAEANTMIAEPLQARGRG